MQVPPAPRRRFWWNLVTLNFTHELFDSFNWFFMILHPKTNSTIPNLICLGNVWHLGILGKLQNPPNFSAYFINPQTLVLWIYTPRQVQRYPTTHTFWQFYWSCVLWGLVYPGKYRLFKKIFQTKIVSFETLNNFYVHSNAWIETIFE